ncbi:MAG: hypothetical protein PVF89_00265 [Lysobacterales bacterium]
MKRLATYLFGKYPGQLACAILLLSPALAIAGEASEIITGTLDSQQPSAFLLNANQARDQLPFDLGGSQTRKLALRLDKPLTLAVGSQLHQTSSGVGSIFYGSALKLALNDKMDITASLGGGKSQPAFRPLGSILCQNGVLDRGSFHASDCFFINQANVLRQGQVALGLRYGTNKLQAAVGMFQREDGDGNSAAASPIFPLGNARAGAGLLMPAHSNPLLSTSVAGQSLNYLKSETSGINLEFQLGLTTDDAGDVRLGLQLTRVMDASFKSSSLQAPTLQNWAIASPFDSARLSLDWSKGNFSGGIQSFYRDQVQFFNRDNLGSMATFDVQFTWRTPWNANLSVGTSNVLNAGEDQNKNDTSLKDPFEAVYGRIPYVRYQQDL